MKWCPECGSWGDYFRASHETEYEATTSLSTRHTYATVTDTNNVENTSTLEDAMLYEEVDATTDEVTNCVFVRLCCTGLV